ncbi:hypothetical protein VIN01S_22550 [Vibrio inusitatus NBRC 102082]|uniref:Uncharacterized protein n=1 Tax=Vibrio inusitatus NBRC 102082 TaxID=1219070 RepID=A0A4Y3HWV5_9VIBR|nr:hypothetical protein [Vibrio inusitatus]GEA51451.1 hypothetical protein VIN01S_22550 [Vibrio inusitatus NBRC 102082]
MIKKFFLVSAIMLVGIPIYLAWLPFKMVMNSIVPSEAITTSINDDIRQGLLEQPAFIQKVESHKGSAKRYLYRTPLTMFTTVDTGLYDVYATYINDKGEWVTRMGVYPDKNAEVFFPNQIGGIEGNVVGFMISTINQMLQWGISKPMIYHTTNNPDTSFVSSGYEAVPRLVD